MDEDFLKIIWRENCATDGFCIRLPETHESPRGSASAVRSADRATSGWG